MTDTPTAGRIVHYVARGSADGVFPPACRAAIVTTAPHTDGTTGLAVLHPDGLLFAQDIEHDPGDGPAVDSNERALCDGLSHRRGTWHWPARAAEVRDGADEVVARHVR